jgi:hypothetical protein
MNGQNGRKTNSIQSWKHIGIGLNPKIGKCFWKLDISCPINGTCCEVDISKATSFGNILLTLESQLKSVETLLFSMDQPIHECQIISEDFSLKGVCEYYWNLYTLFKIYL